MWLYKFIDFSLQDASSSSMEKKLEELTAEVNAHQEKEKEYIRKGFALFEENKKLKMNIQGLQKRITLLSMYIEIHPLHNLIE